MLVFHSKMSTSNLTHINLTLNKPFKSLKPSFFHTPLIPYTNTNILKYSTFLISPPKSTLFNPNYLLSPFHYTRYSDKTHVRGKVGKCSRYYGTEEVYGHLGDQKQVQTQQKPNFWGAVSLIIGTAVGPGMLGLPSATLQSGPLPSTIAILLSWVYVISSIILVAELSFATMEENDVKEVSFTGLATKAFGAHFGTFVSFVYATLSFSLLVACVSGIGSIVSQWLPNLNNVVCHSLFPMILGCIIWFFPFKVIDSTNRMLCVLMLVCIVSLVGIGVSVARANILVALNNSCWNVFTILPAIPVTVLTLGFHVITPFICNVAGGSVDDARKAILVGGIVPLIMVLSWNMIVLGLAGTGKVQAKSTSLQGVGDPIKLLLSVKSSALFAVQGFAFTALATSFIGYAVSFPKQLIDTFELILGYGSLEDKSGPTSSMREIEGGDASNNSVLSRIRNFEGWISVGVLIVPVLVASFYPSTFSRALDFAGVYANCFLFGILPPAMAYIYKTKRKLRSSLPGGDIVLFLLFSIAVILSIWH